VVPSYSHCRQTSDTRASRFCCHPSNFLARCWNTTKPEARKVVKRAVQQISKLLVIQFVILLIGGQFRRQEKRMFAGSFASALQVRHSFFSLSIGVYNIFPIWQAKVR